MSGLNWEKDRRRSMVADITRHLAREDAREEWSTIRALEHRKYRRIAEQFQDWSTVARSVLDQLDAGKGPSQGQAQTLMRFQAEQDRRRSDRAVQRGKRRAQEGLA